MIKYLKVFIDQIKKLLTCFSIYLISTIIFLPLHNYFNKFQINAKYGKEFTITILLSTLLFCIIYLFIKKNDLKIILLSFLFPVLITFTISIIEQTTIYFNYFNSGIFYLFIFFFIYALFEEIICRLAMLNRIYNSTIQYFQIITSSLLFSLFHFGNNSFGLMPFNILFLSGVVLSFIYLKTNLLTATLAHAFWNFSSSVLMGGNLSGLKVNYSLFTFVHLQDNIINGGGFGIEGSLITLIILLTICLIMFFKIHTLIIFDEQN